MSENIKGDNSQLINIFKKLPYIPKNQALLTITQKDYII